MPAHGVLQFSTLPGQEYLSTHSIIACGVTPRSPRVCQRKTPRCRGEHGMSSRSQGGHFQCRSRWSR